MCFKELGITGCSPIIEKMDMFFNQSNICTNHTILKQKRGVIYDKLNQVLRNTTSTKCMKPCRTITYKVSFRKMNENARLFSTNFFKFSNFISFGLYYDEFVIYKRQEYFVTSIGTLISTIGGLLGTS